MIIAAIALFPSFVYAQPDAGAAPPAGSTSGNWLRLPPGGTSYFPPQALQAGVTGNAVINCAVDAERHLQDCQVVSETPPDMGFGQKALEMARLIAMKPGSEGKRASIPIRFALPDPAPTPLMTAPSMAAERIALWQAATSGMTVAEVKGVVPEARATEKPEPNKDGWVDLLVARKHQGQHDQEIHFQFKDGGLMGVTISEGAIFGLAPISVENAETIFANLNATYGRPVRCKDTNDGFHSCFWLKHGKFVGYLQRPPPKTAVILFAHVEQPSDRELLK